MAVTAGTTPKGIIRLKEPGKVAVRVRTTGGTISADQLAAVVDIAGKYSGGQVHLTTRQGLEIAPVDASAADEIAEALAAVGIRLSPAGPTVRGIVCCPALACRNGVMDGQGLAHRLDEAYADTDGLHAKVKIAVSGCPNGCSKPAENDLGVTGLAQVAVDAEGCTGCGACETRCKVGAIAIEDGVAVLDQSKCIDCGGCASVCPTGAAQVTRTGWRLLAGGKMGRFPRLAQVVAPWLDDEGQVLQAVGKLLELYRASGRKGERLGDCIARTGLPD